MAKIFVLDSSILLAEGRRVFHAFNAGSELCIPLAVLQELESKRNHPDLGYAARDVLRFLESLRTNWNLRNGAKYGDVTIRIEINHINTADLPQAIKDNNSNDSRILAVAKSLGAVLISKDLPLRLLAGIAGVEATDIAFGPDSHYEFDKIHRIEVSDKEIDLLFSTGYLAVEDDIPINSGVIVTNMYGTHSALAVSDKAWKIRLVADTSASGIRGRSAEQRIALNHLLNEDIPVVSLSGNAGTGKTVLALAAAVEQMKNKVYKKIVVFRTLYAVGGQELGYLPGTADEKMEPWTAAIYDALEAFLTRGEIDRMVKNGQIEILPLTHIRGRTLSNSFVIVDEAQNLERSVLLTAISRLGAGSKIALSSDVAQRDNLHVGRSDGITEVISRLYGEKLFAHVALKKSERSPVAEMAARLLDN